MLTSQMIKDYARACSADAVGVAPLSRFEGAPKEMDPRYIYPEAKSIIGFIFRIPRGYIRDVEEQTHYYQYGSLGYAAINEDIAPTLLYNVGRFIEDAGYEAAVFRNAGGRGPISDMDGKPGFTASPEEHKRALSYSRPVNVDYPAPDIFFQFRIAAYLCGLGEIGYSKMLLTPEFGPLNRQAFILTDAELEPDPIFEGELCDKCMACAGQCPGHCISTSETVQVELDGHHVEWGKLNEWDCFTYYQGASLRSNPFITEECYQGIDDKDDLLAGKKHITASEFDRISSHIRSAYSSGLYGYNLPKCGGCLRACYDNLERKGRLRKSFKNRFRQREVSQLVSQ